MFRNHFIVLSFFLFALTPSVSAQNRLVWDGEYAGAGQNLNNLYPAGNWDCAPMPALRRYYDAFEFVAMSESTRPVEAMVSVVLAYFSSQNAPILAIELIDFQGFTEGKTNNLIWRFADTKDLNNVEVQKSIDGKIFTPLSIKGKNEVQTTDETPFKLTYYRLKINELDGSSHFSKVIVLKLGEAKKLKIVSASPNPTDAFLDIQFEHPTREATTLEVFNTLGQLLFSEKIPVSTTEKQLNTAALPSGSYVLKVKTAQIFDSLYFIKK